MMPGSLMRGVVGSVGVAAALGVLCLGIAGCSEEQAAIGTIEMGNADKNNLMSFGAAEDAPATQASPRSGGRGTEQAVPIKSLKRGGGGGVAAP